MLLLLAACGSSESTTALTGIELGAPDGATTTLDDAASGIRVVNLWATWCGPCVREMPVFETVAQSRADATIIGVNVGDSPEAAAAFAEELGISYPILTDPRGDLQTALGVASLPATAFISPAGDVLDLHIGALDRQELEDAIDRALEAST